jgi:malic enzyme
MVDEFMEAVRFRWPNALVQFEDFDSSVAQTCWTSVTNSLLNDTQGISQHPWQVLRSCAPRGVDASRRPKIVIAGAGSAGIGISQVLPKAMIEQDGAREEEECNFICDKRRVE